MVWKLECGRDGDAGAQQRSSTLGGPGLHGAQNRGRPAERAPRRGTKAGQYEARLPPPGPSTSSHFRVGLPRCPPYTHKTSNRLLSPLALCSSPPPPPWSLAPGPLTWLFLLVPVSRSVLAVGTTAPPSTPFVGGPALAWPGPLFSDLSSWGAGTPTVKKLFKPTAITSPC